MGVTTVSPILITDIALQLQTLQSVNYSYPSAPTIDVLLTTTGGLLREPLFGAV